MAESPEGTPKTTGWTEAQKLAFLLTVVDANGTPNWSAIILPPGRTRNACELMLRRLRAQARESGEYDGGQGPPSGGTKRKKPAGQQDGDGQGQEETPTKKKGRKPRASGKAANSESEEAYVKAENEP